MKTRTFIDQGDVIVRSGKGGDGSASSRREAPVAFGGPDGGARAGRYGVRHHETRVGVRRERAARNVHHEVLPAPSETALA